jgi:Chlorophyll A-B binding protein
MLGMNTEGKRCFANIWFADPRSNARIQSILLQISLDSLTKLRKPYGNPIMYTSTETPAPAQDRNRWVWGFTPQAELWNGRFAMIGFVSALLTEMVYGQGTLHFLGLM